MPEQKNLELLRPLRAAQQYDQLKQSAQAQIGERPNHAQPPKSGEGAKLPTYEPTPLSEYEPSF
jgi:hypothetical protein